MAPMCRKTAISKTLGSCRSIISCCFKHEIHALIFSILFFNLWHTRADNVRIILRKLLFWMVFVMAEKFRVAAIELLHISSSSISTSWKFAIRKISFLENNNDDK